MPHRMLITAGPTHEPIDAVRYLANRSSGRLGIALAEAAHARGWHTTLLLGPTSQDLPPDVRVISFESAANLQKLLDEHFPNCDVLIMAAAVADYRPAAVSSGKLPRQEGRLTLELESTPDLVAECARKRRPSQHLIGFALEEPERLHERAVEKLRQKGLDALVANPLATMGAEGIAATLYAATGEVIHPPAKSAAGLDKPAFARWLIDWIGTHVMAADA